MSAALFLMFPVLDSLITPAHSPYQQPNAIIPRVAGRGVG